MSNKNVLTDKFLQSILSPALNQEVWHVIDSIGSSFKFEVGQEIENERGEYHFWIYCSHWWLQQGKDKEFVDIVNSESSQENIKTKITILSGKKILHVQYYADLAATIFDFEDDVFLRIAPYQGGSVKEQWQLFTPTEIFSVMSNGTYQAKSSKKE